MREKRFPRIGYARFIRKVCFASLKHTIKEIKRNEGEGIRTLVDTKPTGDIKQHSVHSIAAIYLSLPRLTAPALPQ